MAAAEDARAAGEEMKAAAEEEGKPVDMVAMHRLWDMMQQVSGSWWLAGGWLAGWPTHQVADSPSRRLTNILTDCD